MNCLNCRSKMDLKHSHGPGKGAIGFSDSFYECPVCGQMCSEYGLSRSVTWMGIEVFNETSYPRRCGVCETTINSVEEFVEEHLLIHDYKAYSEYKELGAPDRSVFVTEKLLSEKKSMEYLYTRIRTRIKQKLSDEK